MTNTEKLSRAITLMKECQKFKAPFLTTPISLVSEVLTELEEEAKWMQKSKEEAINSSLEVLQMRAALAGKLAGYLYEGRFITDLSDLNGVTMNDGNHPVPLYRKEK